MAVALHSFKIDADGRVLVQHVFYGETEDDARAVLEAHADACPKFGPAYRQDETEEIVEEIDELPTPDTLDDFVAGDVEDDDVEDDEE